MEKNYHLISTKPVLIALFCILQIRIASSQPVTFTEVAQASGLWDVGNGEFASRAIQALWVDFDGDEDLDLFYTEGFQNLLFQNQGDGSFVNIIQNTGLEDSSNIYLGSTWADMNNDGLIDAFFKTDQGFSVQLYQNVGNGFFQDVTLSSGIRIINGVQDASWMDYDRNGFLDLFIGNIRSELIVYKNNSDGTFTDVTAGSGLATDSSRNVGLSWADYDSDGDLDLFIAREQTSFSPAPSTLYRLESDGSFTDVGESAGVKTEGLASVAVWGDYNLDGFFDLYIARVDATNLLFLNRGDGTFEEVGAQAGVNDPSATRSVTWVDVNNDGLLDLHVVNFRFAGPGSDIPAPDRLYFNNGDGTFTDIAQIAGIEEAHNGWHAVWGDYDRDGDMDAFVSHFHLDSQSREPVPNFLYRNETMNNWLEVNLEPQNTPNAVGVQIFIYTGNRILLRETNFGSIQAPQNANRQLFGLGEATQVDSLRVRWPGGRQNKRTFILANQALVVKESQGVLISVQESWEVPKSFKLYQNYPNPFNPETTIQYELAQPGHVELTIYNLLGQRVEMLVNEVKPEGEHLVEFNGSALSSGVYFYKLEAAGLSQVKKMILMK